MKIIIAGGTGFIGSRLVLHLLEDGHALTLLSREPALAQTVHPAGVELRSWSGPHWPQIMEGADAVINLAGASVVKERWTQAQKKLILRSRLHATHTLVDAMAQVKNGPKILINASAVGFYGPRDGEEIDESAGPGHDFLADVCQQWEAEAKKAEALGVRVALLRIGVVLGLEGGALKRMILPFRLGLGGRLGSGRQYFPWIHIDDVVGLIRAALHNHKLAGPINAVAPNLVTNAQFTKTLGHVLERPAILPVPAFALKLMLGEMSEMLLTGQKVVPSVAEEAGYTFLFPDLDEALHDLLQPDEEGYS